MAGKTRSATTVAHKVAHELWEYALLSAYLYVCFGALLVYKTAILRGEGISYTPYGIAIINALVLGKFILVLEAVRIGDRYKKRRPIHVIAHKALLFLVTLFVLYLLEEVIVGIIHGRTVAASLAGFLGGSLLQILANCFVMLLILIPYLAFKEVSNALGEGRLRQLLFEPRVGYWDGGKKHPEKDGSLPGDGLAS